ncbi:MAG: hypothetical protein ACP5HM_02140 [Anaerolineae bacterium]
MTASHDLFAVGVHRPVYLWAGPGTIRMNRLKFMDAPVNERVHLEAYTLTGATRIAQEALCNWAYLTYDWGFPPEIEREDWEAFKKAVPVYHAANVRVFGYVQLSNYVNQGTYRQKDWYAVDAQGRPFYYYTGRYMACWQHPAWRDHLKQMVWGVVSAGADGVFLDNPWYGVQPRQFAGAWLGGAGCYCERCRATYREATGLEIPREIDPAEEASQIYLRWRAEQVTQTIGMLANYARSLNPEVLVSVNDFDSVMRPSFVTYGIDLKALRHVQDVLMIEDFALPQWRPGSAEAAERLVNNALTIRAACPLIGETPLSVDPYDRGIGFDEVYAPRRFRQGIAEAAACGVPMVVKGTEFIEADGTFTLLTAEAYAPQREAIGALHAWLREHAALYQARENAAQVALLHPGEALWQRWVQLAPLFFGAAQTLTRAAVPWRVVTLEDDLTALETLLHITSLPDDVSLPPALKTVFLPHLEGWELPEPAYLARHPFVRRLAARLVEALFRAYFRRRWVRKLMDAAGLPQQHFLQTPYFDLPGAAQQERLLAAVDFPRYPLIRAESPLLVEHWRQGARRQLHLVNYAADPQTVEVQFRRPRRCEVLTPSDASPRVQEEACLQVPLDVYTVLIYT